MLARTQALKSLRLSRTFSTSIAYRMPDDHAGRAAGATAHSSTFSKKEQAEENMYIREHERKQIEALRKKLEEQKAATQEIEKELDSLQKKSDSK